MSRQRAPVISPGERIPLARGHARGGGGRVWAFASGAGGVGRSTLSSVLAARLVLRGHTVCLVDADWASPVLASMMDVPAGGPSAFCEAPVPVVGAGHPDLRVLTGMAPLVREPSCRDCRQMLGRLRSLPDSRLVLDLPGGAHDASMDLWLAADVPLLVVAPERLPLEATANLLARVFSRQVGPWLARRLGADATRSLLEDAWRRCEGRTGSLCRAVARGAGVPAADLERRAGRKAIHLVLNRVRRGDDVEVGHALVDGAREGLGLDLRYRGVIPFDEQGWIRARRTVVLAAGQGDDVLGGEVDDLLDRVQDDVQVAPAGGWRWSLQEAARASSE